MIRFRVGASMAAAMGTLVFVAFGVVGAQPAFAATARYVTVTGSDSSTTCRVSSPCATLGHAASVAAAGDTIYVGAGTFVQQATIGKSVKVAGEGAGKTIFEQPATLTPNADGQNAVIAIDNGATVTMSGLTVQGLGDTGVVSCSPTDPHTLDQGIAVVGGATLNLSSAAVQDIGDPTNPSFGGCQFGTGILVGTPGECSSPCTTTSGHATITTTTVTSYQKAGVADHDGGSTLTLTDSRITDPPSPFVASNGVEVFGTQTTGFPKATLSSNTISGNECNLAGVCGPDFVADTQSTGILVFDAAAGTLVNGNTVTGNDIGIYAANDTPLAMTITGNIANGNRDENLFVDAGTRDAKVTGNTANASQVGIVLNGPVAPPAPYSTPSPVPPASTGNTFAGNIARNNAVDDLMDLNTAGNALSGNTCGTAFPSKAHWGCP